MRSTTSGNNEKGSATIIALLIMVLLMAFVALAVSRTTTETLATANDETESKTFAAAQASLENMTRDFDQIFETKLTPSTTDIDAVEDAIPDGFGSEYDFSKQKVVQTALPYNTSAGSFLQGLTALRDEWRLDTVVTHKATDVKVSLRRAFYNDRVPIFQFGIFYNDDLEFHPGPRFDFGGRVHSNANLFLMADTGLYFSSKVSAVGQVLTDVARNGRSSTEWGNNVFVRNGSGTYIQLGKNGGSVLHDVTNGPNVFATPQWVGQLPMPTAYKNSTWPVVRETFQGNLISDAKRLDLPLKISSRLAGAPMDYIELIKRGKEVGDKYNDGTGTPTAPVIANVTTASADGPITTKERYTNKPGIRVSLANSRDRLPGCASAGNDSGSSNNNRCGVRLDGPADGKNSTTVPGTGKGYQPKTLTNSDTSTKVNGDRFNYPFDAAKASWIKIELVQLDTSGAVVAVDVTEDLLSLGVTERAPSIASSGANPYFSIESVGTGTNNSDQYADTSDLYSIIKLQRFMIPEEIIDQGTTTSGYISTRTCNANTFTMVIVDGTVDAERDRLNGVAASTAIDTVTKNGIFRTCSTGNTPITRKVAPFPIKMFDTREGLYNDSLDTDATYNSGLGAHQLLPRNGVMSMIDIDVTNLRSFLMGNLDTILPATGTKFSDAAGRSLKSTDVPSANGWVFYVSDRRGDYDFDGEYDMEDIFGNNDGILQPGEDVNNDSVLEANYTTPAIAPEAVRYNQLVEPDEAAVIDTRFYRRGVRLINGTILPGNYNSVTPANTRGFTLASENGVYTKGNYNATSVSSIDSPTDPDDYQPHDTVNHIPASVVGDSITILSNNWNDARSFRYPFTLAQRQASDTVIRFAILSGDAISSLEANPNQGGGDPRLTGGVHNFKRFLEDWGGNTLSYSGSLINLYNAHNNNGAFKCCSHVYSPPNRNWVFDISFMDPTRLPPGTPFFQSIQLTGFQRINE